MDDLDEEEEKPKAYLHHALHIALCFAATNSQLICDAAATGTVQEANVSIGCALFPVPNNTAEDVEGE